MSALAPYDAVLVVSFGGPDGPDDVWPFLRRVTAGRDVPDERLAEVADHYRRFGGRSPINDRNRELVSALAFELGRRGVHVPIVVGNRNWHPLLAEALAGLAGMLTDSDPSYAPSHSGNPEAAAAVEPPSPARVLCLFTSAYASYSGCRQYREDLASAQPASGRGVALDKIGPYAEASGFIPANADALVAALQRCEEPASARVVFVTHSVPTSMDASSGPGPAEATYSAQHLRVAERVTVAAASELGFVPAWDLAFCSRSGPPQVPWLAPDVNDRLRELAAEGVREVVVSPIGFIHDHMEVVYDLDTEAAATASGLGLRLVRAATAGVHPAFVGSLVDALLLRAAVARGEASEPPDSRYHCSSTCCRGRRPLPAACEVSTNSEANSMTNSEKDDN